MGFLIADNRLQIPAEFPLAAYLLGLAWAWILIQAVGVIRGALALKSNPLPTSLDFADRGSVRQQCDALKGSGRLAGRARNLLAAWSDSLAPGQVIGLAQFQSQQNRNAALASLAFGVLVIGAAAWQGVHQVLVLAALAAFALVHLARQEVDRQTDQYVESRLLSRLSGNLPNTAMTSKEVAECLSRAVNGTFEKYMPKPEQIAAAVQAPVDAMTRETVAHLQNAGRALVASYEKIAEALSQHAGVLSQSGSNVGRELDGVLQHHVAQLHRASESVAGQLEKVTQMQSGIEQVLKVQKAVDGTLRDVATAQEFRDTITTLRRHLDESDKLLREIAKPRTIRLVESEHDA